MQVQILPARFSLTRISLTLLAAVAVAGLAACGGGGGSGKATQVAVKVNKDEITVLQVNEQLARLPAGVTADKLEPATRQILGSLVNQQLLVQQAIEHKLDRDPQIVGALEAARLNILAQAYVQRVINPQAKPTDQEVKKYYADNPALFADRKVFNLAELAIEANADQQKEVQEAAASAHSLKQLAEFLRSKKIAFSANSGVRPAEQLPLGQVAAISHLKSGSVMAFVTGNDRMSALEVLASQAQPVDDKKATPVIQQYLENRKQQELAVAELNRLRDAAKIEYVGDFTKYSSAAAPATATAASATAAPAPAAAAKEQDNKGIAALR